jgi:riboflavin kinase/FMN adenylyltransferase
MAIFYDISKLPKFNKAVLTVGTFDGVHKGHAAILQEVVQHARDTGGESVLITFDPHPRKLLFPHQPLGIITPLDVKLALLKEIGITHTVVVPFTTEFANFSATAYIQKFLVDIFHPHSIVIGYDHRFGHDRLGDINMLRHYATKHAYELVEIPAQLIEAAAVSSTRIRHAIKDGFVEEAANMLGRWYPLTGLVVEGNQLGRTIGYPTANLEPVDKDQIIPGNGIYAIVAKYDGQSYRGMMSIGFNPTVTNKREVKLEANLFGFDKDIYGKYLEVAFVKRLRNEEKFDSIEDLTKQLHLDKVYSLEVLKNNGL